ncbi:MAG TPA: DUF4157 domain-containing protein [Candidatus Angelobacter sp.]
MNKAVLGYCCRPGGVFNSGGQPSKAGVAQPKVVHHPAPFVVCRPAVAIQGTLTPGSIQRMRAVALQAKTSSVQPKLPAGVDAFEVNLQRRTGGWTLPKEVQTKMEAAMGADFSDVRIHVGPEVASIGAIAFTWGTDIHFAPGYYNPHSMHGQQLLGHELTHVLQQRAGRVRNPFGNGTAVVQDHALEAEADRMGMKAAMYRHS